MGKIQTLEGLGFLFEGFPFRRWERCAVPEHHHRKTEGEREVGTDVPTWRQGFGTQYLPGGGRPLLRIGHLFDGVFAVVESEEAGAAEHQRDQQREQQATAADPDPRWNSFFFGHKSSVFAPEPLPACAYIRSSTGTPRSPARLSRPLRKA